MRLIDADELLYEKGAVEVTEFKEAIESCKTVKQKHGHWERVGYIDQCCSRCKKTPECETGETPPLYDYCPYCGSKMDEVTE